MSVGETGTIAVDHGSLFFRTAGAGDPLLLVHGVGPDSRGWSPTFERLAERHRVVAYDRRGYGSSSDPSGGGWVGHGEDAAALIQELDLAPATIVGWSGGGYVAIHLAVQHPALVRNVVLAETGLPLPPVATASYLATFARVQLEGRIRGRRAAARTFFRWVMRENGVSTWDRDDYPQERRERGLANAGGIWADLNPRGRPDLGRARLARVQCPVTLLVGDSGQSWFRKSAEALAQMLPNAGVQVIEGTNHAFTFHQPDAFADAIAAASARAER